MKTKLESLIEEAKAQAEEHPSKDARWFANSVYEYLTQRQPEQEPEIWGCKFNKGNRLDTFYTKSGAERYVEGALRNGADVSLVGLYTSPPQRQWVGLTDEEIFVELERVDPQAKRLPAGLKIFAHYLEARLREKNTPQDGKCKYCTNGCVACDARFAEKQEPVVGNLYVSDIYKNPPKRQWIGLNQEEFEKLIADAGFTRSDLLMIGSCLEQIVDLVEAKLRSKNT